MLMSAAYTGQRGSKHKPVTKYRVQNTRQTRAGVTSSSRFQASLSWETNISSHDRLLVHPHPASHEAQKVLIRLHHALEGRGGVDLLALVRVQRDGHLPVASPQRCGAGAGRQAQHLSSIDKASTPALRFCSPNFAVLLPWLTIWLKRAHTSVHAGHAAGTHCVRASRHSTSCS